MTSSAPAPRSTPRPAPAALPGYRTLRVWQRALDLAVEAAHLTPALAAAGHDAAGAELLRAGAAVPAHIAAGGAAATRLEHQRVLHVALAAVARFETVLALAERLAPDAAPRCAALLAGAGDVSRQLRAFARAVGGPPPGTRAGGRAGPPAGVATSQIGARAAAPAGALTETPTVDDVPAGIYGVHEAAVGSVPDADHAADHVASPPSRGQADAGAESRDGDPVDDPEAAGPRPAAVPAPLPAGAGAPPPAPADAVPPPMPARAARARRTRAASG